LAGLFVFRRMRVWPFDLHETLRADGLVAAARAVEVGRVVEEADGTFGGVFVEVDFDLLAVDVGVVGEADFLRRSVG
jgi:hypothetical protein